jgi:eukaryotic-like serine/threonine-protein kinase
MAAALTKAGRYQIVGELGRGSMGIVYQGFDPIIGRTVAIKTMLPEGLSSQEFQAYRERFQREAMAAGVLAHPNIITIYDFGDDNGVLYLAMEYLEGKSLDRIVQEQGILPVETILPIYDQVCSALDHAHLNNIVHRDIKPANIMILQNGTVKVTDFGIAKVMAMGMTQVGQILGTPNYMSPEQVKGRQIDGRSDIFSLGVILYELVTAEKPFGGQNITTVIYKIVNENPVPPRELDASIPAGLSYVISKALAKNVEDRYQTCRELAEDLRNYRNLGGGVMVGSGTAILDVSPIQAEVAEPIPLPLPLPQPPLMPPPLPSRSVDETPISSSLNVHATPPAGLGQRSIPLFAWVLAAILIVAIIGVTSYFFVARSGSKREISPQVVNVPPAQHQPASLTATPPPPPLSKTVKATTSPSVVASSAAAQLKPAKTRVVPPTEPESSPTVVTKAGQLIVSANVTGARISVDGRSDPMWLTPYTIPDLPAGAHTVVISKDGYDDFQQSVTVAAGESINVEGNLSLGRAEVNIVTVPPGVEVLIDGKSYGPSPVRATLVVGNHVYKVIPPDQPPYENSFTLTSGQILTKRVTLTGFH